jgi:hypothetical protein
MTQKKFKSEVDILKRFFSIYCNNRHKQKQTTTKQTLDYSGYEYEIELCLCDECKHLVNYSFEKLQSCAYEEKPRCRNCDDPCYEKKEWRDLAKIMRYSGVRLGFVKIKSMLGVK